jgi:hypothetical protein
MRYWYTEEPETPAQFRYSQDQYEADEEFLRGLIEEIANMRVDEFRLTDDVERCRFCVYRSLCDRGTAAGPIASLEDDFEDLQEWLQEADLDQVQEIEF